MAGAYLLYHCRLCHLDYHEGHAPDGSHALLVAQGVIEKPSHWRGVKPQLVIHHECPGESGTGLADLIGAVPDGGDLP